MPPGSQPRPEVGEPTAPGVVAERGPIVADIDGQLVRVTRIVTPSVDARASRGESRDSLSAGGGERCLK